MRTNTRTCILLAAVALIGLTSIGCAGKAGAAPRDLAGDCRIAEAVFTGVQPILAAKCAQAKDPVTDGYCLASVAGNTAIAACFAAASRGAPTEVDAALADLKDAKATVPLPEQVVDGDTTSPDAS